MLQQLFSWMTYDTYIIHMHLRLEHPYRVTHQAPRLQKKLGDHWVSKPTCGRRAKTADDQKKTTVFRVHSQEFLARVDSNTSEFEGSTNPIPNHDFLLQ